MTKAEFTAWKEDEKARRRSPEYRESRQKKAAMIRDLKQQLRSETDLEHIASPPDVDVLMSGVSGESEESREEVQRQAYTTRLADDEEENSCRQAEFFILYGGKETSLDVSILGGARETLNEEVSSLGNLSLDEYW